MSLPEDPKSLLAVNINDAKIAELKKEFSVITYDVAIANGEGYTSLTRAIALLRDARGNLEDRRKTLKAPYLEAGRIIDAEAKRIEGLIFDVEIPLKGVKDQVDQEKARIKKEKEEAERKRLEEEMRKKIEEENRIKAEAEAKRKAEEEAARAEQERIMAEQKAELDRIEAERKAEAEKLEEERRKLEAERKEVEEAKARIAAMEAELAKVARPQEEVPEEPRPELPEPSEGVSPTQPADETRKQDIQTLLLLALRIQTFPMPHVESDRAKAITGTLAAYLLSIANVIREKCKAIESDTDELAI